MTILELRDTLGLHQINGSPEALAREVTGCYVGDLLSWVMGRAEGDQAWITIMRNANVAAVAQLTDVACVILAEGVTPDETLSQRAQQQDLPLFNSDLSGYELCWRFRQEFVLHGDGPH